MTAWWEELAESLGHEVLHISYRRICEPSEFVEHSGSQATTSHLPELDTLSYALSFPGIFFVTPPSNFLSAVPKSA